MGCLSYMPHLLTESATQLCALTRNWTADLSLSKTMPNQLRAAIVRATFSFSFHHLIHLYLSDY